MMDKIRTDQKIKELHEQMATKLKNMRVEVGFTSPRQVSKEIGAGEDAIYKLETMQSLPSKRTLMNLIQIYRMNNKEYKDLVSLRNQIIKLRKEVKKATQV